MTYPHLQASSPSETDKIIKLAILAVGGQGGGVLTNWIEDMARSQGYEVQATSVAGVAQRTGATIYYVEMAPKSATPPVFSLAPSEGDVDILIAAEMMEAGRAILRGFVTPDQTTLIASTHRTLAISEKSNPGNGISASDEVQAAAEIAAQTLILFDMERIAANAGSVISASLFGALAASNTLPFPRSAFEAAIKSAGRGVAPSLKAFDAAFEVVANPAISPKNPPVDPPQVGLSGSKLQQDAWQDVQAEIDNLPPEMHIMAQAGLRKVASFQDVAYGRRYLKLLDDILHHDSADRGYRLGIAAAKYIAKAMAYEDVLQVAALKTRPQRFHRIKAEMHVAPDQIFKITEFMHPRAEEITGLLPANLGKWLEGSPSAMRLLHRWFNKGRRINSNGLWGFLQLYCLAGLRRFRLRSRRHHQEMHHMQTWLTQVNALLPQNYDLAVELLTCHRLIKGYADTQTRGQSKFDHLLKAASQLAPRKDAAQWMSRLQHAALQDEDGKTLKDALKTIESFSD